jgi:hypothetical protein
MPTRLDCLDSGFITRSIDDIIASIAQAVAVQPGTFILGVVVSRHFETHGRRPHRALGSDLVDFRESFRIKAKREARAE